MFENSLIVVNIKLDNARWFLRGLNKPFDPFAQKAMHDTMIGIANCTEAVWAYHIGNEIVLYLNPNAISRCKTMLSGMTRDNLVSYIASLTTVIFNLNYGRLMEKLDKCSNIEKIRLDNYKSKQYLARFDCAVRECDRDITPIIKTIKNTQEIHPIKNSRFLFAVPVRAALTRICFAMPHIICLALRNTMVKVRLALSTITVR